MITRKLDAFLDEFYRTQNKALLLTGIDAANLSRIKQGKFSTGVDILSRICVILDAHLDLIPNSEK